MTTTAPSVRVPDQQVAAPAGRRHAALATVALVLGGFAIGTTEFVTMGLLPQIADGVGATIPQAGHTISAYAVGVVIGAPLIAAFGAGLPRRGLLAGLMAVFVLGNVAAALAPSYGLLVATRFVSGLPHGAFFGVASLVAVDLARAGREGRAVGRVMLGIPLATILGVPTATWLGQAAGWRTAYWLVGGLGLATIALVALFVPTSPRDRASTVARELRAFLNLQVVLTLLVGAIGFGGMFAMYSYIAPTVTEVTGLSQAAVPLFLLAFGLGALVGTMAAGRLADWSVLRTLVIGAVGTGLLLGLFVVTAYAAVPAFVTVFLISALGSLMVVALQLRLMAVAGEARTLGAASNHASLNLANALGAWLGGVVIDQGFGYTAPSVVGVALSFAGVLVLGLSLLVHRRDRVAQA